jgi:hypothetical protein
MSFLSRLFGQKSRPTARHGGLFRPACSVCGQPSATIEVIAPHTLPVEWASWSAEQRRAFTKYRSAKSHQLLYDGPGGNSGWTGSPIDPDQAEQIVAVFSSAPNGAAIRAAGFYDGAGFCADCGCFYCSTHWAVSSTGYGTCPRGHGKSLDPHWHPDFDE